MEILLNRQNKDQECTTGELLIDGIHECYTLEDTDRGLSSDMSLVRIHLNKVFGRTAIPRGRYKVERIFWQKHNRFVPHIIGVPGFTGILIHSGVTADDTLGCPLVGVKVFKHALQNTIEARKALDKKIFDAIDRSEDVYITVQDQPAIT